MTTIFISSSDRSNGEIYNFNTQIPNKVLPKNKRFQVKIIDLTLPFTFNQLNSTFNTIDYSIVYNAVLYTSSITIKAGSYNIINLLAALKTALQDDILLIVGVSLVLSFTYDRNTMHCILGFDTLAVATTLSWTNTKFNKMLGFGSISFTNLLTQESSQPVNVNPVNSLYIRSNNLNIDGFKTLLGETIRTDILMKVPLNSQTGSIIQFHDVFNTLHINDSSLSTINFKITDENGDFIELLLDWNLTLRIEIVDVDDKIVHEIAPNNGTDKTNAFLQQEKAKTLNDIKELLPKVQKKNRK